MSRKYRANCAFLESEASGLTTSSRPARDFSNVLRQDEGIVLHMPPALLGVSPRGLVHGGWVACRLCNSILHKFGWSAWNDGFDGILDSVLKWLLCSAWHVYLIAALEYCLEVVLVECALNTFVTAGPTRALIHIFWLHCFFAFLTRPL